MPLDGRPFELVARNIPKVCGAWHANSVLLVASAIA
jgi:hypothetical protein